MRRFLVITILFLVYYASQGQNVDRIKMHAHNDYEHKVPFWQALASGFESIEVDVFLADGQLFVAHEKASILPHRTIESLYFKPIEQALDLKLLDTTQLQLVIDIKSEPYETLNEIISVFQNHPKLVEASKNGNLVLVISGNRPLPSEFIKYPDFIQFDFQSLDHPGNAALAKIAMVSLSFRSVSSWNGKGRLVDEDFVKIKSSIDKAHALNKPFRFWSTPDSKTAWKNFSSLGVDYINTDLLEEASDYLGSLSQNTYVTKTIHHVYKPTFDHDGKLAKVKNIILLIGDGMGLAQISAGMLANHNQLTLTQLKNIGLSKTQSADDFTTDSAAGGSSMATGKKTKNRYIGVDTSGNQLKNIPEFIEPLGFKSGLVTTDHLTGATPAAFYAHQSDRGMTQAICNDLLKSPIALLIGAGKSDFQSTGISKMADWEELTSLEEVARSEEEKLVYFASDNGLPDKLHGRENYLPDAVHTAIEYLSTKKEPFFLMVEGAFIDSGGHSNNTGVVVEEVLDFDLAVEQALRFADENGETLVIITADHETGGFSIPQGNLENREIEGQFLTHDHTGIMVPVFAYGPHASDFCGVYENSSIYDKIVNIINLYK